MIAIVLFLYLKRLLLNICPENFYMYNQEYITIIYSKYNVHVVCVYMYMYANFLVNFL